MGQLLPAMVFVPLSPAVDQLVVAGIRIVSVRFGPAVERGFEGGGGRAGGGVWGEMGQGVG